MGFEDKFTKRKRNAEKIIIAKVIFDATGWLNIDFIIENLIDGFFSICLHVINYLIGVINFEDYIAFNVSDLVN